MRKAPCLGVLGALLLVHCGANEGASGAPPEPLPTPSKSDASGNAAGGRDAGADGGAATGASDSHTDAGTARTSAGEAVSGDAGESGVPGIFADSGFGAAATDSGLDAFSDGEVASPDTGVGFEGGSPDGARSAVSSLPVAPGPSSLGVPTGPGDSITVVPWAGFSAATSFTFDDSQPSQIANYDALNAVGVPMTFYITTGVNWQSGYDEAWTQAFKDGHEIGNHTVNHCWANLSGCLVSMPPTSIADELDQCTTYIKGHFGQPDVWTGASPYGDTGYDEDAAQRFFVYRGVTDGYVGTSDATDPFDLPCHVAQQDETDTSFDAHVDSAVQTGSWWILLVHSIYTPNITPWYNPVQLADVTGTMSHAKTLGTVWTGTVAEVGAYWRAQKLLSSIAPTGSGTRTWTWTLPAHYPPGKFVRITTNGGKPAQAGVPLTWDPHGYYEVALDVGSLTLTP